MDIEREKPILKDLWVLTVEPKDQLADKPKEIENGADDGEIGKSLFLIVYYFYFYCAYYAAGYIIRNEF